MATFVDHNYGGSGSVAVPAGVSEGDMIVAYVHNAGTTITNTGTLTGVTQEDPAVATGIAFIWKIAESGDAAKTIVINGSARRLGIAVYALEEGESWEQPSVEFLEQQAASSNTLVMGSVASTLGDVVIMGTSHPTSNGDFTSYPAHLDKIIQPVSGGLTNIGTGNRRFSFGHELVASASENTGPHSPVFDAALTNLRGGLLYVQTTVPAAGGGQDDLHGEPIPWDIWDPEKAKKQRRQIPYIYGGG
jgi:hypothetical protein